MIARKQTASARRKKSARKPPRLSPLKKPKDLTLEQWQTQLRRQAARETKLIVRNTGDDPVFSEFAVKNPATKRTYRVVIRGDRPGVNFCSCPDYAVNTLGTCKHIEATLRRLRRGKARILQNSFTPPFPEVYVRYGDQRTLMFSPGSDCPAQLKRLAGRYFDAEGRVKPEAVARLDKFLREVAGANGDVRVYDDALALVAELCDAQVRSARLQRNYGEKQNGCVWQNLLKTPLYPYQRDGALFAASAGRVIIADEMGLGKTLQALAAAEILARECGIERVLIVCPASLKSQWQYEIERFCTRPCRVITGQTHQRRAAYAQGGAFFKIVNYDVIHRDLPAIAEYKPDLVILDEAQRIKNWQTRTAKTVKQIASPFSFVLTGTPLENRLEELHSIVEFVDRFRLGPLFRFKAEHEIVEENSTRVIGYRNLKRITETLAPILIRRTKDQVLTQLPPRMDKNFFVPMTEQQWVPHNENKEIVARIVQKWHRYHFLTEADQLRLRIALQNMRMVCDSTYLIDRQTRHGLKIPELSAVLEEILEQRDAKVVIFSQWLRMNELVTELLEARKWGYVHLHGGVPSGQRKELTRALREDEKCRVFLSTDAGGVGLNLQTASAVVNMDLPWNPAVLEQRIGRVHRLGQSRPVRVVNFVAERTIEHGMLSLLSFKRSMFAGVIDGATDKVLMGDSALNRFMKTVETATSSVPGNGSAPASSPSSPSERSPVHPTGANGISRRKQSPSPETNVQAVGELLAQGASFLQSLARELSGAAGSTSAADAPREIGAGPRIVRDDRTGRGELRIPLPDPEILNKWLQILGKFQVR